MQCLWRFNNNLDIIIAQVKHTNLLLSKYNVKNLNESNLVTLGQYLPFLQYYHDVSVYYGPIYAQ